MSASDLRKSPLRVTAAEEATEIFVIDSALSRVASGVGQLEVHLDPGIYKVRMRSGTAMDDTLVEVKSDQPAAVQGRPVAFQSAAPLPETLTTHEPHEAAWAEARRPPALRWGEGAGLFVMVRDPDLVQGRELRTAPWSGIAVRDRAGAELGSMERDGRRIEQAGVAWLHAEAPPGMLELSVDTGLSGVQCLAIHAVPGWQAQVILSTASVARSAPTGERSAGPARKQRTVRRAAPADAAIFYVPLARGEPTEEDVRLWRLTEMARQALAQGRPATALEEVRAGRWDHPMLALLTAHIEAAKPEPDRALIGAIADELAQRLVGHPDVVALRRLADPDAPPAGLADPAPPMLAASLPLLLGGRAAEPGSLLDRIQSSLLPGAPWLVWRRTAALRGRTAPLAAPRGGEART